MQKQSKSFLIVADGEFLPLEQLLPLTQKRTIVALDRAAECLLDLNIAPDIVVGDLDSIRDESRFCINQLSGLQDEEYECRINDKSVRIVYRPNQNETDFFKAIRYIDGLNPQDIHVICGLSFGRLDHLINNLRALRAFYQKNRPIYFYSKTQIARLIKDETIKETNQIGAICGIFCFPDASFSSKGLKYDGDDFQLSFGFSESVANEFSAKTAEITVVGEALFIQDRPKNP